MTPGKEPQAAREPRFGDPCYIGFASKSYASYINIFRWTLALLAMIDDIFSNSAYKWKRLGSLSQALPPIHGHHSEFSANLKKAFFH